MIHLNDSFLWLSLFLLGAVAYVSFFVVIICLFFCSLSSLGPRRAIIAYSVIVVCGNFRANQTKKIKKKKMRKLIRKK
jgi:hypothetical protein